MSVVRDAWVRLPDTYVTEEGGSSDVEISVEGVEDEDDLLTVHLRTDDGTISVDRAELAAAINFGAGELVGARQE